jgi:DNA-binding NarL/FixJ family response regulator
MNKISVAIVEDLDEVRESLMNYINLDREFHVLASYANGEDAVTGIKKLLPDIVIMDINLPGINGIECINRLKPVCPNTQFLMLTVYENNEQIVDALKAGANGYLLKRTGLVQIIDALKELHSGGSPMSSHIARKLVSFFRGKKPVEGMEKLSDRENEILHLLADGLLYKEISDKLKITTGSVRQHIHKIYEKLHVQNRTEAINKVFGKTDFIF